ncbi:HAMP domain-containing protein [Massilia arenosa]|uniref:HAMP domain-containing protein n=1 Tax=Zemynaea arenosa TaxID=2561931 RepID=A0A4Y9S5L2_9BURK|nr:methyl-accepting chemotaxis protein [Massilia arenosa]TFW16645.1 HAMP domain-containing protein [Massilia arenosa]
MTPTSSHSIAPRVLRSFLGIFVILMVPCGLAAWNLRAASAAHDALLHGPLARQQLAAEWLGAARLNSARTWALAKSDSLEAGDYFQQQLDEGDRQRAILHARLRQLPAAPAEQDPVVTALRAEEAFLRLRRQLTALKDSGRTQDVERLAAGPLSAAMQHYVSSLDRLVRQHSTQAERMSAELTAQSRQAFALVAACAASALAAAVFLAWRLARSIIAPLQDAVTLARHVAEGQLDRDDALSPGRDEIGQLFTALQHMTARLAAVVTQVRDSAHRVDDAAREMNQGNAELAHRTAQQAVAVERTVTAMSELAATVRQNHQNARLASDVATASSDVARQGGAAVHELVTGMDTLEHAARRIVDIIAVIDSLAFQTNLLALNAAVEAARAGEHGRGFAVVAGEVRRLAQRSAAAAGEIKVLIHDATGRIGISTRQAHAAGETMQEVVASVARLTAVLRDIATASAEQDASVQAIEQAVGAIDDVTQRNAHLVQQASAAARSVHAEATGLTGTMKYFSVPAARLSASPQRALVAA